MKLYKIKIFILIKALFLISSCGKKIADDKRSIARNQDEQTRTEDRGDFYGVYQAKFMTLNPHINGTIPGSANFFRKKDDENFYVYVRFFAGGANSWHMQHIYTGSRCPNLLDDKNSDGFIDIQEAEDIMENILIPLDSDLNSQDLGQRFFPISDLTGYYFYERVTNFDRFLNDLRSEDTTTEDNMIKLKVQEEFDLTGKTVLIQGVSENIKLPETVATKGKHRAYQTLPVTCGVFQKIEQAPGDPYVTDRIPGPIAEVEEGQDRPAPQDSEHEGFSIW
jgi:hypothetical protein